MLIPEREIIKITSLLCFQVILLLLKADVHNIAGPMRDHLCNDFVKKFSFHAEKSIFIVDLEDTGNVPADVPLCCSFQYVSTALLVVYIPQQQMYKLFFTFHSCLRSEAARGWLMRHYSV